MYTPKLARFTARDPLPEDGVLVGGISEYAYANNNPANQFDPSGMAPVRLAPGSQPGTFNIFIRECTSETLKTHPGCCCSEIFVQYKPTVEEKARYKKICVKVWHRMRFKKTWWCSDTDTGWEVDKPKDKQSCWPPNADWTDYPGGDPVPGIFSHMSCPGLCATTQIRQDFEGCAIGETASGKQVTIGCTWWGHQCDVTHSSPPGSTPPCLCFTTCKMTRFPPGNALYDVPPLAQKPGTWDPITDPPSTYR